MSTESEQNKIAWEYRAYEFWNSRNTPDELAKYIVNDSAARLRYHEKYFNDVHKMSCWTFPHADISMGRVTLVLFGVS